VVFRVMTRC